MNTYKMSVKRGQLQSLAAYHGDLITVHFSCFLFSPHFWKAVGLHVFVRTRTFPCLFIAICGLSLILLSLLMIPAFTTLLVMLLRMCLLLVINTTIGIIDKYVV